MEKTIEMDNTQAELVVGGYVTSLEKDLRNIIITNYDSSNLEQFFGTTVFEKLASKYDTKEQIYDKNTIEALIQYTDFQDPLDIIFQNNSNFKALHCLRFSCT